MIKVGNQVRFLDSGPDYTYGWPNNNGRGFLKMKNGEVGKVINLTDKSVTIALPDHQTPDGRHEPAEVRVAIHYFDNTCLCKKIEKI